MTKYRVTTNGEKFRVETLIVETYGLPFFRKVKKKWIPLTDAGFIAFLDDECVATYDTREEAESKLKSFNTPPKPWIPV